MASKTREKLIESAKQLFLRNGVENTTISDIANASDKGRRTIYTYFKNKRDIYRAVIERESDRMVSELKAIAESSDSPSKKLQDFINSCIAQARFTSSPSTNIKSLLSLSAGRAERTRKLAIEKEEALLRSIIQEGIETGEFDADQALRLDTFLYGLMRSIDLIVLDEDPNMPYAKKVENAIAFVLGGLCGNR